MLARLKNQLDRRNGTTSDTAAHLLRWITVTIVVAAFHLASSLSCELSLRAATDFTNHHGIAWTEFNDTLDRYVTLPNGAGRPR
jgi:hypothetical protein